MKTLVVTVIIVVALVVLGALVYSYYFLGLGCNYDNPSRNYAEKSRAGCSTILIECAEGASYFSDRCGCGCLVD